MRVRVGYARVIEIECRFRGHANAFHHGGGSAVVMDRERDDFGQAEVGEAMAKKRLGGFGSVALSPVFGQDAPADLDCGRKCRLEAHRHKPGETDGVFLVLQAQGGPSETIFGNQREQAVQ